MAAIFNIQEPYVLASLPRPLNTGTGTGTSYAVGDVWGQQQGSKKRKRSELAIGIDGEAVNIYDVPSSKLITSYPMPPQSAFTCPPCSTRWRIPKSKDVVRYTYISTRDPAPKITLFKDVLGTSGNTKSTSLSTNIDHPHKIVHLSAASSAKSSLSLQDDQGTDADLIAVTEDGSILCFQGGDLQKKWQTSPEVLRQDLTVSTKGSSLQVELVQSAVASDVITGLLGGKQDAFGAFRQTVQDDTFNPDMLVLVTKATVEQTESRHFHVLVIVPASDTQASGSLVQIHASPIPSPATTNGPATLRLDINSGSLMELQQDTLNTYDLTGSTVKLESKLQIPDAKSFLRLSRSSVLTSTTTSLDVYNPLFRSKQASTAIGLQKLSENPTGELTMSPFSLVAYFARLEIAIAIHGVSLVVVQLEAPRSRDKKRKSEGLLIDSIGRGIPRGRDEVKRQNAHGKSTTFSTHLPGSLTGNYWSEFTSDIQKADELFAANDLAGFEEFLAGKLGIKTEPVKSKKGKQNGAGVKTVLSGQNEHNLPEWQWPATRSGYPPVDRRWVLYAITRVFSWQNAPESDSNETRLVCSLPESNILYCLVDAGHLTIPNLKSAFKDDVRDVDDIDYILGEEVPQVLVQVDPLFELVLNYLLSTKLGAVELLTAIRLIMRSLELVQDPTKIAPKLLTFESQKSDAIEEDGENAEPGDMTMNMELDRLEHELEVTEHYLGDESSVRARGLSVAFGKLGSCPQISTVKVLRRSYKPEEILSLIYVLRMELVKDGWTTRYLDTTRLDEDDELEAPPDGSIRLIADLLCRCIDSVGPGGWLINDAIVAAGEGDHMDSADFLASLKLEVSAALEGVEEAVFLKGIISEAVRFGVSTQVHTPHGKRANSEGAVIIPSAGLGIHKVESAMLPLGMKANGRLTADKVISGGEVVKRKRRETGHLVSKKVEAYSLERIAI